MTTTKNNSKQKIKNEFFASRVQNTRVILGDKLLSAIDKMADKPSYADEPRQLEKNIVANNVARIFLNVGDTVLCTPEARRIDTCENVRSLFGVFSIKEYDSGQKAFVFSFISGILMFSGAIDIVWLDDDFDISLQQLSAHYSVDAFGHLTITTD